MPLRLARYTGWPWVVAPTAGVVRVAAERGAADRKVARVAVARVAAERGAAERRVARLAVAREVAARAAVSKVAVTEAVVRTEGVTVEVEAGVVRAVEAMVGVEMAAVAGGGGGGLRGGGWGGGGGVVRDASVARLEELLHLRAHLRPRRIAGEVACCGREGGAVGVAAAHIVQRLPGEECAKLGIDIRQ